MRNRTVAVVATLLVVAAGAATATGVGATGPTASTGSTHLADGSSAVPDGPSTGSAAAVDRSATVGGGPSAGSSPAATPPGGSIRDQVETDEIRLRIDVDENGNARWTVEYFTRLDDENTTAAFESLQDDIRANPEDYTARFAERIRNTVQSAENATGREMSASNFEVDTRQTETGFGVIAYTYTWTNFARVEAGGDRLVIGDAIDGYLLDDKSTMIISWSEGYERTSVDPGPDSTSELGVSWEGDRTDFLPGQPRVTVERSAGTTGTTGTTGATGTTQPGGGDTGDGGGDGGINATTVLLVLVVLGVAAVGIFYFTRSGGTSAPVPVPDDDGNDGAGDGTDAGTEPATAEEDDDEEAAIDEELLSNEERVLRLLERNGGRIKQQEVVQELGWTEAKTSQVVSGMRDEGTIDGFRLGRENVLTLPDVDQGPAPDDGEDGEDGEDGDDGDDDRSWNQI